MTQATVTKLSGLKPWRVTDEDGQLLRTRHGKPIDCGGYASEIEANRHAAAINQAAGLNQRAAAKASVTKRQRTRARRQIKQAQRERLKQIAARDQARTFSGKAEAPVFEFVRIEEAPVFEVGAGAT